MESQIKDGVPVRNGRRVILVMLSIVTLLAGSALFLANKARSLKPARRVPTHLKLQETAVELKIELDLVKQTMKTIPNNASPKPGFQDDATALSVKTMSIAKRAARTLKLMPKMMKSVAAEARAMRNDPFSKSADKASAGRRLENMAGFEARTKENFERVRDEAIRVVEFIKEQKIRPRD